MYTNQTLKLHSFGFYVPLGILNPNHVFQGLSHGLVSAAGVPVRGRGGFLLDSPCLCQGFSRRLATTHCPPSPPAVLRCGGCASTACQDRGSRAHSPSWRAAARGGAYRRHSSSTSGLLGRWSQVHGVLAVPRGSFLLGQLSPNDFWAHAKGFGSCCFRPKSSDRSIGTVPSAGGHCARRHCKEHRVHPEE